MTWLNWFSIIVLFWIFVFIALYCVMFWFFGISYGVFGVFFGFDVLGLWFLMFAFVLGFAFVVNCFFDDLF